MYIKKDLCKHETIQISESIAYEFGPGRGIIAYTFKPSAVLDTEANKIAVGFVTSKSDAVLMRIESSNTQDYMQMEIVSVQFIDILLNPY